MKNWIIGGMFAISSHLATAASVLPFQLPLMNGSGLTSYNTADHPNGVFVIEAYFLGCPYCNNNAPNVNALAASYQSEARVQVIDLGIDRQDSDYEEWISTHQPNHPVVKDDHRQVVRKLGTRGYPSTYVIDCHGTVREETSGEWGQEELDKIKTAIDTVLAENCTP